MTTTTSTPWRRSSLIAARLIEGAKRLLHAAEHQRDALRLGVLADRRFRPGELRRLHQLARHEVERGGGALEACLGDQPAERARQPAERQRQAEAPRIGQHLAEDPAQRALARGAVALGLDAHPGEVDEMHVVDAGGTGGHAGEAGEAAVDVIGHRRRDLALLEHLLHEIDAAARGIALVPGQHISRAGRGAEPAMHAAAQDLVGAGDGRVGELDGVEAGLHISPISPDTCGRD